MLFQHFCPNSFLLLVAMHYPTIDYSMLLHSRALTSLVPSLGTDEEVAKCLASFNSYAQRSLVIHAEFLQALLIQIYLLIVVINIR